MTTGTGTVRGWNEQTDTERSRADTVYRSLGQAHLVPQSGKGGGKSAVHWEEPHFVIHALGVAVANPPNTAAKTAPEFVDLYRYLGLSSQASPPDVLGLCKGTIGETLADLVKQVAADPTFAEVLHHAHFELTLYLGRPTAIVTYRIPGVVPGEEGSLHYSNYVTDKTSEQLGYKPLKASTVRKSTINSYQIEMLAGFLRDTWEKQGRMLSTPSESSNSTNGGPDVTSGSTNDDGANLAGKAPSTRKPTRNKNRRDTAVRTSNTREANAGLAFCQASRGGESGQSPSGDGAFTPSRSYSDDPNQRYSASPPSLGR